MSDFDDVGIDGSNKSFSEEWQKAHIKSPSCLRVKTDVGERKLSKYDVEHDHDTVEAELHAIRKNYMTTEELIRLLIEVQFSTKFIYNTVYDKGENYNERVLEAIKCRGDFDYLILEKEFYSHYLEASKRVESDNLFSHLRSIERRLPSVE